MATKPVLQSLVLADAIAMDVKTGKKSIQGIFTELLSSKLPALFGRTTWTYICLTDIRDSVSVTIRYVDLKDGRILLELPDYEVRVDDPLRSVELIVEIPPFPMPHEGAYAFELHWGGELLGSLRITVKIPQGEVDQDEPE